MVEVETEREGGETHDRSSSQAELCTNTGTVVLYSITYDTRTYQLYSTTSGVKVEHPAAARPAPSRPHPHPHPHLFDKVLVQYMYCKHCKHCK